jgi:hypothetical protein
MMRRSGARQRAGGALGRYLDSLLQMGKMFVRSGPYTDHRMWGQGSMTSLAYTFSPSTTMPITSPTVPINQGAHLASQARAGAEGLPFDSVSNTSVGSVNRSVGVPARGGVTKWDGRRWLVDERDEEELQKEAKERFRKRMGASAGGKPIDNSSTSNSTAVGSETQEKRSAGSGGDKGEGAASVAAAGERSGYVPAQAMLTCFYSLHGGFMTEVKS